ncbi:MAG: hypothetical protein RI911_463 [Candidatus Parcubacteria bacterium]|jgi:hypothetical protein
MSKGSIQKFVITDVRGAHIASVEVRVAQTRSGHFFQEWLVASWKQLATMYGYTVTKTKVGGD